MIIINEYIDFRIILLTIIVGIFIYYLIHTPPKIILENPLPQSNDNFCCHYKPQEVSCN